MANISKQKRDRMLAFLNELRTQHTDDASIRAFNEIENQLLDKKYGLVWEDHTEEVDELLEQNIPILSADSERRLCKDEGLPWNFLIEGDNLQALYLLEKTHKGKIDCIYIDPPYNTGAKDWKYNNDYVVKEDLYRHSLWISMMHRRLSLARNLLAKDGVLITTIDDNELANLYLLIEEIFPEYHNAILTIQMNPGGTQSDGFSVTNEYAIVTYLREEATIFRKIHIGDDPYNLRRWGSTSNRYEGATCFYPVIISKEGEITGFGDVLPDDIHPTAQVEEQEDGSLYVWPIDKNNVEKKWRYARDTVESVLSRMFFERSGDRIEIKLNRETEPFKTVWVNDEYNSESHGTKLIKSIIGKDKFSYPKSLYATRDCLMFAVAGKPDAVILDFFAGSGTTMHAVNLLNAEDGGNRTCISVTNNEVSADEEKAFAERNVLKGSEEWESKGIARYVTWPRIVNSINGVNENGEKLSGNYLTTHVEKHEIKRKYTQIDYITEPMQLSTAKKKRIVATLCSGKLPQSSVTNGCKYAFSTDSKYTATILFDDTAIEEWIDDIKVNDSIDSFFIITTKAALFRKAKEKIENLFEPIYVDKQVLVPMSVGFDANIKYFKCDWTPRRPENYLLSNVLCLHIREMIELQNAIEIDNIKNVLILNKDDFRRIIQNPDAYEKAEKIWVNQNIIFNAEELKLLHRKGFKYIPKEFFGQELKEAAE